MGLWEQGKPQILHLFKGVRLIVLPIFSLASYYVTKGSTLCGLGVGVIGELFLAHSKRIIRL